MTCVASKECPPISKKFSSVPMRSRRNTSCQIRATPSSVASFGATYCSALNCVGLRQRLAVHLSVGIERDLGQNHHHRRHHEFRQMLLHISLQFVRRVIHTRDRPPGRRSAAFRRARPPWRAQPPALRQLWHRELPRFHPIRFGTPESLPGHRCGPGIPRRRQAGYRAKSPVRYIRVPASVRNGFGTNRSSVLPVDSDSRQSHPPRQCKALRLHL